MVDQSYGRLTARSTGAEIVVRKFRGDELDVRSVDGTIELNEIHADRSHVESTTATVRGDGITGERLEVRTASGNLALRGVDPAILALGSDSGKIDLATRLKRTREADIHAATGDVTLRVGELAYFDLEADSKSVKSWGLELEALTADGSQSHHRRGNGGAALRVRSGGELTVRPYEGSRLGSILQED